MTRFICFLLTPVALLFLAGCSPYIYYYQYSPRPGIADIPSTQPQQPPPVSAMATIVGIHQADSGLGIPLSVEVRLNVENNGPYSVALDIPSMQLMNGELLRFLPPVVSAPQSVELAPGDTANLNAFFPFPPNYSYSNTNMESLQLRWRLTLDGTPVNQVIYFHRVYQDYYPAYPYGYYGGYYGYPYAYPWFGGVGFRGVVVIHGGHGR